MKTCYIPGPLVVLFKRSHAKNEKEKRKTKREMVVSRC